MLRPAVQTERRKRKAETGTRRGMGRGDSIRPKRLHAAPSAWNLARKPSDVEADGCFALPYRAKWEMRNGTTASVAIIGCP